MKNTIHNRVGLVNLVTYWYWKKITKDDQSKIKYNENIKNKKICIQRIKLPVNN